MVPGATGSAIRVAHDRGHLLFARYGCGILQSQVLPHGDKGIGSIRRAPSRATSVRGSSNAMTVVSLGMAYRSFREVLAGLTPASIRRLQPNLVTQIPA